MVDTTQYPNEQAASKTLGALEQKVVNVEGWIQDIKHDIKDLNDSIRALSASIVAMSQPKWTSWIGAATLMVLITGGVWKLAIQPIEVEVARLGAELAPKELLEERRVAMTSHMAEIDATIKGLDNRFATRDELASKIIDFDKRLPRR